MSERIWDKFLPALIGAAAGLLAFFFAGWVEGEKQFEIKKAEAYVEFMNKVWASKVTGAEEKDSADYLRSISVLTLYAPAEVLVAFAEYVTKECITNAGQSECPNLWADVVNAMRKSLVEKGVDRKLIVTALWGRS